MSRSRQQQQSPAPPSPWFIRERRFNVSLDQAQEIWRRDLEELHRLDAGCAPLSARRALREAAARQAVAPRSGNPAARGELHRTAAGLKMRALLALLALTGCATIDWNTPPPKDWPTLAERLHEYTDELAKYEACASAYRACGTEMPSFLAACSVWNLKARNLRHPRYPGRRLFHRLRARQVPGLE